MYLSCKAESTIGMLVQALDHIACILISAIMVSAVMIPDICSGMARLLIALQCHLSAQTAQKRTVYGLQCPPHTLRCRTRSMKLQSMRSLPV